MRRVLALFALLCACHAAPPVEGPPVWRFLAEQYDADHDGRITPPEYTRSREGFRRLDADRDGVVTRLDFEARYDGVPRQEEEFTWGEGGPEVGDPAPEFTLPTTGGTSLSLASFRGQKPVVLVFGSFT